MKKGFVILYILLTTLTVAFSQELRLIVSGKPLNAVLNSLNVEISFDDKALSKYMVSVSRTFKTPEEAIDYLLKGKPLRVEKIGNVFIIVPVDNNSLFQMQQTAINEQFIFNGTVIDSLDYQTLEYATVSLLNADNVIMTTGVTNNKGRFHIETKTIPHLIKISYIGYKTLINEIPNLNEEWGEFSLSAIEIPLSEVVATANIQSKLNSAKYDVTPQMCNGVANALELLEKIPELHYDKLSDKIIVNQQDNVLLLVDGIQHSQHFLKHLFPNRVRAIEVIRNLSGRFVSDDYDVIIQLALKKDYTGFDINLVSRTALNLSETNNYQTENSPDLGIIYTANKFNFFGTYSYNHERWNMHSTKKIIYDSSEFVSVPEKNSNDLSAYESNILTGGINYQVTPRQLLDAHTESRNKTFLYLSFSPSDRIWLKSGLAIEHIKTRGKYSRNDYLRVLPYLQVCYNFNKKINVQANYSTNQSYPSLYQLSPMSLVIDTFLTQVGNPVLKSALRHQVFTEFTFWNKIKIIPQFVFVNDGISEMYERKEFKLFRTFGNIQIREYSVQAIYDQALSDRFRLKNAVLFYYNEARQNEVFNSLNGWTLQSEINYRNQPAYFDVQLGYYRNMRKNILWQGYQMQNRDYWCVSVQKELWNNRISVMMSYVPPISSGIRYERIKAMETPVYQEKTIIDMASQKQMLLLRVNVRLERGSIKPVEKRATISREERGETDNGKWQ